MTMKIGREGASKDDWKQKNGLAFVKRKKLTDKIMIETSV